MIKVVYGPKGMGKTKILIEEANKMISHTKGSAVFIDDSEQLIYNLKHQVRFVNVSEFPAMGSEGFLGFLCGILSQNYDIEGIFIDRLNFITKVNVPELETFFKNLSTIDEKNNIKFLITLHGDEADMPAFLKQYI